MPPTLTVLMTTYRGTTAAELRRAVASVLGQTRTAEQFVLVVDGPVPPELERAIDEAAAAAPSLLVERLPENVGSGHASHRGLALSTSDFVARQDSDDISLGHRLERQLGVLEERGLDIVGSYVDEFDTDPANLLGTRTAPLTSTAIARRLRVNNPVNNPSMVFRRELAVRVGGYQDVPYHEDYDLVARMIAAGGRAQNIPETLVLCDTGNGMLGRRSGVRMLRYEWLMQRRLRSYGVIGPAGVVRNLVVRGAFRLLPRRGLPTVYRLVFRRGGVVAGPRHATAETSSPPEPPRPAP